VESIHPLTDEGGGAAGDEVLRSRENLLEIGWNADWLPGSGLAVGFFDGDIFSSVF
jgi:hypothetical protein